MSLEARQYYGRTCVDRFGRTYRCNTAWYSWGRWVALAVILIAFFLLFFLCSCISARRRRRAGRQPFYGTGWTGRVPVGHAPAQYNPGYNTQQPQQYNAPPPNYNQTAGYGANQGYFGGQRDHEMQAPQNVYQGGENGFQPPSGPPPGKVA